MTRIIVASASENSREYVSRLLSASGFSIFRCCASGSELRRALSQCEDGVAVLLGALPDCRPDELQWDYGDRVQILLIARPPVLESCEAPGIFRLALPVSAQALISAVQMLCQLHRSQLPRRAGSEREIIEQAKAILMARHGITESEAHRALQRHAMNHGVKMTDYAAQIIQASRQMD